MHGRVVVRRLMRHVDRKLQRRAWVRGFERMHEEHEKIVEKRRLGLWCEMARKVCEKTAQKYVHDTHRYIAQKMFVGAWL